MNPITLNIINRMRSVGIYSTPPKRKPDHPQFTQDANNTPEYIMPVSIPLKDSLTLLRKAEWMAKEQDFSNTATIESIVKSFQMFNDYAATMGFPYRKVDGNCILTEYHMCGLVCHPHYWMTCGYKGNHKDTGYRYSTVERIAHMQYIENQNVVSQTFCHNHHFLYVVTYHWPILDDSIQLHEAIQKFGEIDYCIFTEWRE